MLSNNRILIIKKNKMKKVLLALSIVFISLVSCSKDEDSTQNLGKTKETYIDASSKTTWNYYSFSEKKIVGTGEENDVDNESWSKRSDWDFAVCRYSIRTNSGASTSISSQGGVYTFNSSVSFSSVSEVPENATFVADRLIATEEMNGTTTNTVKSEATVIVFKKNEDGSLVMPPIYLQAPVYIFRTANGEQYYKVQFTQYQNENSVTGHVKFYSEEVK